ncbi:hypothetical protein DPMN_184945 [Dreissena polymorpha]|uniref:Uncharacterized protein n=1 Tax=Dreissena polymorpha TaxID=45954 RepID=A0A9D4DK63_DREPO|nr:hypothetical protein DPMN_184945 [Dreissena polymorpha]
MYHHLQIKGLNQKGGRVGSKSESKSSSSKQTTKKNNLVILKMYKDCQVLQTLLLLMTQKTYCVYPVLVLQFSHLLMNQKKHFVLNATNCSLMEKIGFAVIVVTIGMIGNVLV